MSSLSFLLTCLAPLLSTTTFRQLAIIAPAICAMTGRITMLGISRWTDKGGSYRTVQRFFATRMDWLKVRWTFIRAHFFDKVGVWLLAGDEVVVTKSGQATHGLARFFSSLFGKPVPGLSFFALSLIHAGRKTSYPLEIKQQIRPAVGESSAQAETPSEPVQEEKPSKRKAGRPKGSKNKNKAEIILPPYLTFILEMITAVLAILGRDISIKYLLLDGAFGHNNALQMAKKAGLELISKLQKNAELYLPYEGAYAGRGRRRKYGERLNYHAIPKKYLKNTVIENDIQTDTYQMAVYHKLFDQMLNVVVIYKTNLKTQATAYVILFSSDLELAYDKIVEYYSLRFQIEFDFRDAKQYWGLEDFMNVKEQPLTNAVNLAFFMVNLSRAWIDKNQSQNPDFSILDLKAHFRGLKYLQELLKCLPEKPDPIVIAQMETKLATLGAVHT